MRYFDSGRSSSYVIISPKEKDRICIIENEKNLKIEELKSNETTKIAYANSKNRGDKKLTEKNIDFLKVLKSASQLHEVKSGSGFKRIS